MGSYATYEPAAPHVAQRAQRANHVLASDANVIVDGTDFHGGNTNV